MATKNDNHKPTTIVQIACLIALVSLAFIDASSPESIHLAVYAIIAGVLFGVGNINKIFGGK